MDGLGTRMFLAATALISPQDGANNARPYPDSFPSPTPIYINAQPPMYNISPYETISKNNECVSCQGQEYRPDSNIVGGINRDLKRRY